LVVTEAIMVSHLRLPVTEQSQVGHARREAAKVARTLNLGSDRIAELEIVVTEGATNLLRHANGGEILVRGLESMGVLGVEILVLDRGAGMANVASGMRDGYSTAGGLGGGLGAMKRLSSEFDLYSFPQKGTALRLVFWAGTRDPSRGQAALEAGAVCVAKSGEDVCGDAWLVEARDEGELAVVADGLGHGPDAATAANAALHAVALQPKLGPARLVQRAHLALRATRGAALAICNLDARGGALTLAGVGNVSASVTGNGRRTHLVSHNGIVGHEMRKVQEFAAPWPPQALLVMHSDGMSTHWDIGDYPGLTLHHAGLIAGVLYRDFSRGRDDVTVVTVRNAPERIEERSAHEVVA
jgi:anti-sigma regulatory factor (Ser/Thr protein kinase)